MAAEHPAVVEEKSRDQDTSYQTSVVGPPRIWGLDPLHKCGIKLFICEVLRIPQLSGFSRVFNLYGHAVTRFDIAGRIVSKHRKETFVKFEVDDGTGVIACCVWLNTKDLDPRVLDYEHGDLLSVSGKISIFREEREIAVDRIVRETDANYETFHWMQVMKCRALYKEPRILPKNLCEQ